MATFKLLAPYGSVKYLPLATKVGAAKVGVNGKIGPDTVAKPSTNK
jgi:hypothetical protein